MSNLSRRRPITAGLAATAAHPVWPWPPSWRIDTA